MSFDMTAGWINARGLENGGRPIPWQDWPVTTSPALAGAPMEIDKELKNDLNLMLGRITALHTFSLVIAQTLQEQIASSAAAKLEVASERIVADMLALPVADVQRQELQRVLGELETVLRSPRSQ